MTAQEIRLTMPTMENDDPDHSDEDMAAFVRGRLVGDMLAAARGRSISKREAARRAGFSESQWRALEAGKRTEPGGRIVPMNPRTDTLAAACLAVDADMRKVFEVAGLEVPDAATLARLANPTLGDVLGAPGDVLEDRLRLIEARLDAIDGGASVASDEITQRREAKRPTRSVGTVKKAAGTRGRKPKGDKPGRTKRPKNAETDQNS